MRTAPDSGVGFLGPGKGTSRSPGTRGRGRERGALGDDQARRSIYI